MPVYSDSVSISEFNLIRKKGKGQEAHPIELIIIRKRRKGDKEKRGKGEKKKKGKKEKEQRRKGEEQKREKLKRMQQERKSQREIIAGGRRKE